MARQRRQGHEVHLMALTRGGADPIRVRRGYSLDQMSDVRLAEMREAAAVLGLTTMLATDLPDGALAGLDPRSIAKPVRDSLKRVRPHAVVTHPVRGDVVGRPDRLTLHAVVKWVFCETRSIDHPWLQRLAFALPAGAAAGDYSPIQCVVPVDGEDLTAAADARRCYSTLNADGAEAVDAGDPTPTDGPAAFTLFQETPARPLEDLLAGLEER
jgi:N-acetylglucosamine malate deacetylase 2